MTLYQIIAIILGLAAVFAYINERLFQLPNTIGVMLIGLVLSLGVLLLGSLHGGLLESLNELLTRIDFDRAVLEGMLSFLLFAGALHVNINDLAAQKWVVGILATIGVTVSTVVVGLATWGLTSLLGLPLDPIHCFIFGALISPTDPIAVLGILKKLGAPKELETIICGESLFNDGVGVVLFLVLVGLAAGPETTTSPWVSAMVLFAQEAGGGVLFGLALGWLTYFMLRSIDNYHVEVLISLAAVAGGYSLASALHLSGPIAVVVAGLMAGNQGRLLAMSETTRQRLDDFWELVDEILNVVLFVLIGVEVVVLTWDGSYLIAGAIAIPMVLAIRAFAVGIPISLLRMNTDKFPPHLVKVLTWGGLRGGISVALALSLTAGPARDAILTMTYIIVVFSIAVQGLTVGRVIKHTQQ